MFLGPSNPSLSPDSALQEPSPSSAAAAACTESKKDLEDELAFLLDCLKVSRDLNGPNKFLSLCFQFFLEWELAKLVVLDGYAFTL